MQHSRKLSVVNEARTAEHLVRNIEPRDGMAGENALVRRLCRHARARVPIERNLVGELPIARRGVAGAGYDAVADSEHFGSNTEPFGCGFEEDLTDFRSCVPKRAPRVLNGKASRGDALVRTDRKSTRLNS